MYECQTHDYSHSIRAERQCNKTAFTHVSFQSKLLGFSISPVLTAKFQLKFSDQSSSIEV